MPEQCCYQSLHVCSGLRAKESYFQITLIFQNKHIHYTAGKEKEKKD